MIRILYLEDDIDDFDYVKTIAAQLEGEPCILDHVESIEIARQNLDYEEYDLLLVDAVLRGTGQESDGIAFARDLIAESIRTPVVILTGRTDMSLDFELVEWISQGRLGLVGKDKLTPAVLADTVHRALSTRISVLLLDDSEDDYEIVCSMLERSAVMRYRTDWAESVEKALDLAARKPFDVFLVDYSLGMVTSTEFIETVIPQYPDRPLIVITDFEPLRLDESVRDHLDQGRLALLPKCDLSTQRLGETILHHLNLHGRAIHPLAARGE